MRPHARRHFLTVIAAMLFLMFAADSGWAKSDEISSRFVTQSVTIDGRYDDWKDNPGSFLEKQKAVVAVSNDQDYLYLLFRTNDPRSVRAIAMSGLTVYFDIDGGKRKDFHLKFIGGPSREQLRSLMKQEFGGRTPEGREMPEGVSRMDIDAGPRDSVPALFCFVKDRISEKSIPLDGVEGPAAAFDTAHGFFVYEFAVPLKESDVRYYGLGAGSDKPISVGLIWGEESPMRGERPNGGMGGGGMGGGMGGGGGMGRPMGGPQGGMERPSKQEVWLKTTLAKE